MSINLNKFNNDHFDRGMPTIIIILWVITSGIFFNSWLPGSTWRIKVLKLFGAKIGKNVVFKQYLRIKYPWKLRIGDNCWIGESVWIDNLDHVLIGNNTCLSQGVYLCTGSHNFNSVAFDLITKPIQIGNSCWLCANVKVKQGAVIEDNSIVPMGKII